MRRPEPALRDTRWTVPLPGASCLLALLALGCGGAVALVQDRPPTTAVGAGASVPDQGTAAAAPCILVYGHGRNFVAEMPAANAHWNELNQRFTQGTALTLSASGRRAVSMALPVEARDVPANLSRLLQRASAEGCDRVVEATVMGDAANDQVIVRLRLHAIARAPGPPRLDSGMNIGTPELTVQRELPLNHRTLARVMSDELARQMSTELLDHLNR